MEIMNEMMEVDRKLQTMMTLTQNQEQGIFLDINIFAQLGMKAFHSLWRLWELILVNQPILICSNDPTQCSETVLGIISLISPLKYYGEFKPYFTIYDPQYKDIQTST